MSFSSIPLPIQSEFLSIDGIRNQLRNSRMEAVKLHVGGGIEVFGREGVAVKGGENRDLVAKDNSKILNGRYQDFRCSTSNSNDMTCRRAASDQGLVSRSKKDDTGLCMLHTSLPSYPDKTSASRDAKSLFISKQQHHMKTGKAPKTDNSFSKRPRHEHGHGHGHSSKVIFGDFSALTGSSNSSPKESTLSERRKHSLDGRRGDKRHFKQPTKSKLEPFFSKSSPNSSPSTGGGSIFGIYGLKSDTHDVTKHIEDLSLSDLLDGSYKYPSSSKDKGKKTAGTNENLVLTIKSACSILKPRKSPQPVVADLNISSTSKVDTCTFGSDSSLASGTDVAKGDDAMAISVQNKETCIETTISPLCEPKNILERLSLPQEKNLDTLLAETSNKSALSRNSINEFRSSKPLPYGSSLPPFPWSLCSNGSSKAGTDTGKICSNRSKWVQIGSLNGGDTPNFDLSSLNFDHESSCIKETNPSLTEHGLGLCVDNQPTKGIKSESEHSPRLLAGAQLLFDIARHSDENQANGKISWPKRPSQKSMKARKPRTNGKLDGTSSIPRSLSRPNDSSEIMDKKPRYFSPNSKKMDIRHMNHIGRPTIKWSVPTSNRSLANGESKLSHSNSDSVRLGHKRPLDRPSDSKLRKVVSMDWGRGKSKNGS